MDGTARLLKAVYEKDQYGVEREALTGREVFCKAKSVTRSEFFNAGRNGLNPQLVLTVFAADYEGERLAEYGGQTYAIYRTYKAEDSGYSTKARGSYLELQADYIELYLEAQGGANGKTDPH